MIFAAISLSSVVQVDLENCMALACEKHFHKPSWAVHGVSVVFYQIKGYPCVTSSTL